MGSAGRGQKPAEVLGFLGLVLAVGGWEMGWSSQGRLGLAAALHKPSLQSPNLSALCSALCSALATRNIFLG